MSGVGVSFGADRIYDVLEGLGKFPSGIASGADLMFANMGRAELAYVLPLASQLRVYGVSVEVYPDGTKLRKQFEYCERKGVRFLSICGADEVASRTVQIKNLASGEQKSFALDDVASMVAFVLG